MNDDALKTAMAVAIWREVYGDDDDPNDYPNEFPVFERHARAALAVAKRELIERSVKIAEDRAAQVYDHAKGPYLEIAARIRSLADD